MIKEEDLTLIRQKADIVDVLSDYVSLTKKGNNYVCLCPFHNDKNHPSMVVSPEKQIFNCFSCKTGGNVFSFVSKYENVNFAEAVNIVANKVGISLSVPNKNFNDNNSKYKNLYEIMSLSQKYYLNNIFTSEGLSAKKYLENRGINESVINDFSIGVSLDNKNDLYEFLKNQNYSDEDIGDLGLINRSGIDIYDSFKNRIMIPIKNLQNEVVGFTGRIFNGEDQAKYINTKETVIFKKGNILFNYYNAKNYVRESKNLIIVEGNMDAIKMHSSGIKNVVALMGTFLSNEQISILKKLKSNITLLLDNDEAGYNATIKNGDLLLKDGIIANVVRLSDSKDPDEYIGKFGVNALMDNINHPLNYLDFKISDLKKENDLKTSPGLSLFITELKEVLRYVDDTTKSIVISKISNELNIDKSLFGEEKKVVEIYRPPKMEIKNKEDKYKVLASKIFYYIASDEKYMKIYKSDLNFFREKIERDLAAEIDWYYKKHENGSLADFLTYITNNEVLNQMILEIISKNGEEILIEENFIEYLKLMKKKIKEDEILELKNQAKNEQDVDKKMKIINEIAILKKGSVDYE